MVMNTDVGEFNHQQYVDNKIISEIKELFEQNEKEESDKKLLLKDILTLVAENNDVSWGKVKNLYYREKNGGYYQSKTAKLKTVKRGRPKTSNKKDKTQETVIKKQEITKEPEELEVLELFHEQDSILGEVVEVIVTKVDKFGVFVVTPNGEDGLIHISEISPNDYVTNVALYFFVGERLKAKVIKHNQGKNYGFSTKAIGGKKPLSEQYSSENKAKEVSIEKKKEVESILKYFESFCGTQNSISAEEEILNLVENFGLVNTTLKLAEVMNNLNLSKMILSLLKDSLESNEHLRQEV
jgi:predicted RNA-binding protein with RPS1 domain